MKFLIVVMLMLIFWIGNSILGNGSAGHFQCDIQNQSVNVDTIVPQKTMKDIIKEANFKGIIVLDGKKINQNDSFLYIPMGKKLIKEITILKYLPIDSALKYGSKVNFGMMIMKTQ